MNPDQAEVPGNKQAIRGEPIPYFGGGPGAFRFSAWRAAPRRCAALGGAWAMLLLALFLPGCDVSSSGNRGNVRPTYVVYGLTTQYTLLLGGHLVDVWRGTGSLDVKDRSAPLAVACPLFLLGGASFLLTPPLLRRRLRKGLRWVDRTVVALLTAPWVLLAASVPIGNFGHFLYGYYLLAAAHTIAFAAITWPLSRARSS